MLVKKNLFITILIMYFITRSHGYRKEPKTTFRTMTFNIWNCGTNVKNGLEKVAKHVKLIDPDVVAFQEIEYANCLQNLSKILGSKWFGVQRVGPTPNEAIFTRWPIYSKSISQTDAAVGIKIQIPIIKGEEYRNITVFSAHLAWKSYGPYAACNKLVTDNSQIMAGELGLSEGGKGRVQNIQRLLLNGLFNKGLQNSREEPLVVMGDFNTPSHLDYIYETSHTHCGWSFKWPATRILMRKAGMKDAFRELHPDPLKVPGNTWSTIMFTDQGWDYMIPEPQDRIDFTFYRGGNLKPVWSKVYKGSQPIKPAPNTRYNDWPSDHASVVTEFALL